MKTKIMIAALGLSLFSLNVAFAGTEYVSCDDSAMNIYKDTPKDWYSGSNVTAFTLVVNDSGIIKYFRQENALPGALIRPEGYASIPLSSPSVNDPRFKGLLRKVQPEGSNGLELNLQWNGHGGMDLDISIDNYALQTSKSIANWRFQNCRILE